MLPQVRMISQLKVDDGKESERKVGNKFKSSEL